MKKAGLLLIIALVLLVMVVPTYARENRSQVCSAHNDFGLSHGACVSYGTAGTGPAADAVSWCKIGNNFGYPNQGQCVKALKG